MAASDCVLILRLELPEAARRPKVLGFVGFVLFCFVLLYYLLKDCHAFTTRGELSYCTLRLPENLLLSLRAR